MQESTKRAGFQPTNFKGWAGWNVVTDLKTPEKDFQTIAHIEYFKL